MSEHIYFAMDFIINEESWNLSIADNDVMILIQHIQTERRVYNYMDYLSARKTHLLAKCTLSLQESKKDL